MARIPALLFMGLMALAAPSEGYSCYGDISALRVPAMSCTSVRAPDCDLAMIRRTAEADIVQLRKHRIPIQRVARTWCLDPALIAALMSQESRVVPVMDYGWNQYQQIVRQQQRPFAYWDNEENLNQGSTMLVLAINDVREKYPKWTWAQHLRGGICTYHARMGNVQVYEADPCERDNYYVNSVIRRAQYFKRHGF